MSFIKPIRFEPRFPPAWSVEEMWDVEDEYDEIPRWLEPEGD